MLHSQTIFGELNHKLPKFQFKVKELEGISCTSRLGWIILGKKRKENLPQVVLQGNCHLQLFFYMVVF